MKRKIKSKLYAVRKNGNNKTKKRMKNINHKIQYIHKKKVTFKKLNCSPNKNPKKYTCYSDENLHKMRDIWNARHPDKLISSNDSREIWMSLKRLYSRICNKESCWIKQIAKGTQMEKDLLGAFAPQSPEEWKKNPNEWLSSVDIIEVMAQYENTYKCFEFLGPSPIDYDTHKLYGECVWEELCHFNLSEQIKKGKTKIGIIFNTDPHYKPGEHWISLFINLAKSKIFFFDSAGNKIPSKIKKFVDNVIQQGASLPSPIVFKFDENYPVEHQYKNTECGVYSIFFIIHMLEDEYIEKFRKIYYNEEL